MTTRASRWLARGSLPLLLLGASALGTPARAARPRHPAPAADDTTTKDPTAGLKFRDIGPAVSGGRVSSVAGIPGDPNTYYIGAAGGGVWKTTDGGNSWTPVFEKEPTSSIGAVALAPSNPSVIWVGTGEGNIRNDVTNGHGVYLSTDAGSSWKFVGLGDVGQIGRIVVDPHDPDVAFVAAVGKAWVPNVDRGVYKTTDAGKTWKKVLYVNDSTGAVDIAMVPGNPKVLFAAMWQMQRLPWELRDGGKGSGIWRSTDGGDTWTKLGEGLPTGDLGRIALAVAPSNPSHVYALIESQAGMLWESRDMGDHWTKVTNNHALDVRPFYFSQISVSPENENHLFFSSFQLMESTDGGRTAHSLDGNDVHPDHHALWIDPTNPKRMIQGNDGGVYTSYDGGKSWRFLNNLPIGQFYMVAATAHVPYMLCGGSQDNNSWCGPQFIPGYGTMSGEGWKVVIGGDGEYAVPAPSDSNVLYTDSQNAWIIRLDLARDKSEFIRPYLPGVEGQSPASLKYRFNWTSPIAVSPTDANTVYLGGNVVFKSTDGGKHWTVLSPDLTRNDKNHQKISGGPINYDISGAETYNTLLSITLAPSDQNVIWTGSDDGLVHVTRDGGKTWADASPKAPCEGRVYQVGVSPFDPGTAYVAVDCHELAIMHPYVYKTGDYGKHWTEIDKGLPADYPAHVVREDPNQRGFLVLGTDNALYYSTDAGATWNRLKGDFPTVPVWDLQFQPKEHDLLIATHGRGLFVLDDITALEQLTPQVEAQDFHLFSSLPGIFWHGVETYAPAPAMTQVANPPQGVVVDYWLKHEVKPDSAQKRLNQQPVRIVVTGAGGDTIRVASGPAKAGLNRWVWDMRYAGPTPLTIQSTGQEQGGFGGGIGPSVVPGTYTVSVTVNGKTQSQPVQVQADPRLPVDMEAFRQQLAAGLDVRNQLSALDEMLNRVHSLQQQIQNLEGILRDTTARASQPADSVVLTAADSLNGKLKALADSIYNFDVQRGAPEDDIHYLTKFYDKLQGAMYGVIFSYDEAPNALTQEQLAELKTQLQGFLARYNQIEATDVAAFNKVAQQHDAPILVGGGPLSVRVAQ